MKKKILLLIGICFLASGCSAKYELEIYNNKWNEKITGNLVENTSTSPSEYIEKRLKDVDGLGALEDRKIKNIDDHTIESKYSNKMQKFVDNKAAEVASCYDMYKIYEYDGVITVLTSRTFNCFEYYPELDEVTVMIKSNHKLIETNADKVDGYKYYWTINKETKDDEKILLKLDSNKYIFNYEGTFVKKVLTIMGIVAIIGIVSFTTYKIVKKKNDKINEI